MTDESSIRVLHDRSRSLRAEAEAVHPLVAQAFRRRAAELDLVAAIRSTWVVTPVAPDPRGGCRRAA
jgi:hypothetical protein